MRNETRQVGFNPQAKPDTLVLDQRWSELCSGLQDLELQYLDGSFERFRSRLMVTEFGDLLVRRVASQGGEHRAVRTKSMIGPHEDHLIWICVLLNGRMLLTQEGHTTELVAGDLSVLDYAQSYSVRVAPPAIDSLWIGAPRSLIDSYIHDVDALFGKRVDRNLATTQTAWRVASAVFAEPASLSAVEAHRIAASALGILGLAFDRNREAPRHSSYRAHVLKRIKRYIEEHLEEDDLSVSDIARKQGISSRYLAKVFESEKLSVARWIWDRRLERCRSAMREAPARTTIAEIAYANGFKNVSHFCRVFKARYGTSPGALRAGH